MRRWVLLGVLFGCAVAQKPPSPAPVTAPATDAPTTGPADRADLGHGGSSYEDFLLTPAEYKEMAWTMLTNGMKDKHPEVRIQTLNALSQMGQNPRSLKMILAAFDDRDHEVRVAAVVAAGETRAAAAMEDVRQQTTSNDPQMAQAAREAMARLGEAAGLGPGLGPGDHNAESRKKLIGTLKSKDAGVRLASAKELGTYTWTDVPPALAHLFYDGKLPVRLTAAAAYLETWDAMEHPPAKH